MCVWWVSGVGVPMGVRLKLVRALLGAASAEELKGLGGADGVGAASGSRTGLQGRAATRRTGHGFGQPRVAQPEQGAPEAHVEEDIRIDEGGPHPKEEAHAKKEVQAEEEVQPEKIPWATFRNELRCMRLAASAFSMRSASSAPRFFFPATRFSLSFSS